MKKIFISLIACLMLTCCCAPADYSGYDVKPTTTPTTTTKPKPKVEHFDNVKNSGNFSIVKHRETGVMYMINYHGGIIIIVNEDGTPYVQK